MGDRFPTAVIAELKTYVYRLIDPRNGETFYVGKGRGNRVFEHVRGATSDDDPSEKLGRIREIIAAGFAVNHVIHRHAMDDATAIEVEAALIDAYPGLTNVVAGAGSNDFGAMHADEIIRRYEAEEVVVQHRVIFINVNRSVDRASLYDATRYAWKLSVKRAMRAELVLAVCHGIVIEAFVPETWLPATTENFPGRETVPERFGFIGKVADDSLRAVYVQKRTPDELRKPGAANPIRYTY